MNNEKLTKVLDKAKIGTMIESSVFLSTILFSLKHAWCEDISTANVDGITLRINPEWFLSLSERARVGLLCHEAYHVAFEHMLRLGDRDHKKWNKAADHVINLLLLSAGYELPPNGLHDHQYSGLSTQEVYDLLPDDPSEDYDCDIKLIENLSNDEEEALEVKITNIVLKAVEQSKIQGENPGSIPGEILRKVQELINPILPWNDILQRFLTEKSKDDYTWSKPNRRFQPDYYLPSAYSESLDNIAIAIDTSGSVTDEQFTEFLSEIKYIQDTMKPKKITVIDFDSCIRAVHEISENDDIMDIKFEGYGGTNITDVIDWGIENKPTVLLIFTDGEFYPYEPNINFDLMWIIYDNPKYTSKIGETVFYN